MKIKRSLVTPKAACTGCTACEHRCPTKAISMQRDDEGFPYPFVDADTCVQCDLCNQVCPVETAKPAREIRAPFDSYASWSANHEERLKSSSGGVFSLLAHHIFAQGGCVCGAVYSDTGSVHHDFAYDAAGLERMRGSKYVQSELRDSYAKIKLFLKQGRHVLFSGTPCQVGGLNAFLGKAAQSEYLLTLELICEGTPPPQLLEDHIKYICPDATKINYLSFRDKIFGWGCVFYVKYETEQGEKKEVLKKDTDDAYNRAMLSFTSLRPVCYNCSFKDGRSGADIGIGDFWAIKFVEPQLKNSGGASAINVFSAKGQNIIETIQPKLACLHPVPSLSTSIKNDTYYSSVGVLPQIRQAFFDNYRKGLDLASNLDLVEPLRQCVSIINDYTYSDPGAILSSYCLRCHVRYQGYLVYVATQRTYDLVDRELEHPNKLFEDMLFGGVYEEAFGPQACLALNNDASIFLTEGGGLTPSHNELKKYSSFNGLQEFAADDKLRVIYGGSLGDEPSQSSLASGPRAARAFGDFDSISVRSVFAQDYLRDAFGVDAALVLSPIFLKSRRNWQRFSCVSKCALPKDYVAIMLNGIDEAAQEPLKNALSELDCIDIKSQYQNAVDWLASIEKSSILVTSSYNALCFAIVFERPFIWVSTQMNIGRDACDLLTRYDLEGRILHLDQYKGTQLESTVQQMISQSIDYERIAPILQQDIVQSNQWLLKALESVPKAKSYTLVANSQEAQLEKKAWKLAVRSYFFKRMRTAFCQALSLNRTCVKTLKQAKAYLNIYRKGHPHS